MWAYNKYIPISTLKREYPGHPDEALEIAKMQFVAECGEVLGKAVNVSVVKDPRRHGYILTAKLITEPQEADMAMMGNMTNLFGMPGFRQQLRDEINEWLKM